MAWDLWIYTWIGLSVFVASVRGSTSSWAVGKLRGEVDSVGYFCYWRDLSLPTEFPHPMDDTDNICIEIQDFVLVHYDHSYVDLLHDPDLETSVHPTNGQLGVYGQGQILQKTMPKLQSNFSKFLFIFGENGQVFPSSNMARNVVQGQAIFGIKFPRLSPEAEVIDECLSEKCHLQVTFTVKGEAVSSLEETIDDSYNVHVGANARATLLNKMVREEHNSFAFRDVTVSTAEQSTSALLVTVTVPLTQYIYYYPIFLAPGNSLMEFPVPEPPKPLPRIDDGIYHSPLKKTDGQPEQEVAHYSMDSDDGYTGDETEIELNENNDVSQTSASQTDVVDGATRMVVPMYSTKLVALFLSVVFIYFW